MESHPPIRLALPLGRAAFRRDPRLFERRLWETAMMIVAMLALGVDLQAVDLAKTRPVDFATEIRPIFEAHCYKCHGAEKQKADLRLDLRRSALKGGETGPAWVPGNPAESRILDLVEGRSADRLMPPQGDRLTPEQIGRLRAWIDQGAIWPQDAREAAAEADVHWSFRPVKRPAVPEVPSSSRAGLSPIDAFIAARLAATGLELSPEAPKVTLIRRLYWVMLGLPPTPEDVDRFLGDPKSNAFESLVDRVLDDPRYGERWGRHWLDVVRFAETNGFETNRERPNAWRFRDYVIAAFNNDLPFNRFVREQLAGMGLGLTSRQVFSLAGRLTLWEVRIPC